jgi:translation initiation factor 2B subunit (eIF-2B alpha/beta/delta family)
MNRPDEGDVYSRLVDKIQNGDVVVVLGAGVSAAAKVDGKSWPGIPSGKQLLDKLRTKRRYLNGCGTLGEACGLFQNREGRTELEKFLVAECKPHWAEPLPAHTMLARLAVSHYISMNFDSLLEASLERAGRRPVQVCRDRDVALVSPTNTVVIKPHGSVELPETLRAGIDETVRFDKRLPIVSSLMWTLLANRTALYLGFSFSDDDFWQMLGFLSRRLKDSMPHGVAVVRSPDEGMVARARRFGIEVVAGDLTGFLQRLGEWTTRAELQSREDIEEWMRNRFFSDLLRIRGLPTETQVIESLLESIQSEMGKQTDLRTLGTEIERAVSLVLTYRPNYSGLEQVAEAVRVVFAACNDDYAQAWERLSNLRQRRISVKARMNAKTATSLRGTTSVLLYSQSQRVVDALAYVRPRDQEKVTLYISECRPKSPHPFQDAIATALLLRGTKYKIILIPDVCALRLIEDRKVDAVLMGAHAVFRCAKSRRFTCFLNTCGSRAVVSATRAAGIPVKLVFETDKVCNTSKLRDISYGVEEDIAAKVIEVLADEVDLADRISVQSIGYDLVRWSKNVEAITDEE